MRHLLLSSAVVFVFALSGCLRQDFNLCEDVPPHPECADGGSDAGSDAGTDAGSDAGTDAGAGAGSDAGRDAG